MAMDKLYTGTLLTLLILSTFILEAQTAKCCVKYKKFPVPCAYLKGYTIQDIFKQCDLKAVIFKTISGQHFCADPRRLSTLERVRCLKERVENMKKESASSHSQIQGSNPLG